MSEDYLKKLNEILTQDSGTLAGNEIESLDRWHINSAFGDLEDFDAAMIKTAGDGIIHILSNNYFRQYDNIFGIDREKENKYESYESIDRVTLNYYRKNCVWWPFRFLWKIYYKLNLNNIKHIFHFKDINNCDLCETIIGFNREPNPLFEDKCVDDCKACLTPNKGYFHVYVEPKENK